MTCRQRQLVEGRGHGCSDLPWLHTLVCCRWPLAQLLAHTMSSSAEAPKLKKYVIERSADLSGKTREELAAATQASDQRPLNLAQRRGRLGGAGGETAKERGSCAHLPPHIFAAIAAPFRQLGLSPTQPAQGSCAALREVGTDRVQWRESFVCKDK